MRKQDGSSYPLSTYIEELTYRLERGLNMKTKQSDPTDALDRIEQMVKAFAAHGEWVARLDRVEQRLNAVAAEFEALKRRQGVTR